MRSSRKGLLVSGLLAAFLAVTHVAHAADQPTEIPFAGGKFTIETGSEDEKVLKFNGTEVYRQWEVDLNRIVSVAGTNVALFWAGEGGNACGPVTLIVTVGKDGRAKVDPVGEDCGSPEPAVTDSRILFVPYLMPGATEDVDAWQPDKGLYRVGRLSFAPQPDTDWSTLRPDSIGHPMDFFDNDAVYDMAMILAGSHFSEFVRGLSVASAPERKGSFLVAAGCVPHACGVAGSLMIVDPKAHEIYAATKTGDGPVLFWPSKRREWPKAALAELDSFMRGFQ